MKKLNKRILSALLALLLFLNAGPFPAFTAELDGQIQPETAQVTEPAATDPAATDPAATIPGATDPLATDPAATDPAATDPAATDPAATEPAATDPLATDPAATQPLCATCGLADCASEHLAWCGLCKLDDCGKTHTFCKLCGHYDCGKTHVFCEVCDKYDCGVSHIFCETCRMFDCIVDGHGAAAPADAAEEAAEPTESTEPTDSAAAAEPAAPTDPAPAEPAESCAYCAATVDESGSVIHADGCNAAYVYSGAGDVGKYAVLASDAVAYGIDVSINPKTDATGKHFSAAAFEEGTILRVTGWYWDTATSALWYRVGFSSGGAEAGWPSPAWILQKYTNPEKICGVALTLFSGCNVCGLPGCEAEHVLCEICENYDCGTDHSALQQGLLAGMTGSDKINAAANNSDASVEGRYVILNQAVSTFTVNNEKTGDTWTYYHADFTDDVILRIVDWKEDDAGLWYLVEFYRGGIVESSFTVDFPAEPWFLQTNDALQFVACCDTCGKPDCDGNHETETVPSVSHSSGVTVSSEDGIPAGAQLNVSVPNIPVSSDVHLYDIKILKADGTEWQPIDEGKSVTISIPVNSGAQSVDAYHIIDNSAAIHSGVQYISIVGAEEPLLSLLEGAIKASDREGYVAVDITYNIPVTNGIAQIITNSFSVYNLIDNDFIFATENGAITFVNTSSGSEDKPTQTIYATADTSFEFETQNGIFIKYENELYKAIKGQEYVTVTNKDWSWLGKGKAAIEIDPNTPAGTEIWIQFKNQYTDINAIVVVRNVTVTFDKNLESATLTKDTYSGIITDGDAEKKVFTVPNTAEYTPTVPADSRYRFTGWNTSRDGKGTPYAPGESFTPMRDMTLYATWSADNYFVDYNLDGGSGDVPTEKELVANGTVITLPDEPTKANCTFLGWSVSDDGYSKLYPANAEYTVTSDVTMYAVWGVNLTVKVANGTLKLQKNGEYVFDVLENHTYDDGTPIFKTPTAENGFTVYEATLIEGYLANAVFEFTHSNTLNAAPNSENPEVTFVKMSNQLTQGRVSDAGITENTTIIFDAAQGQTYYVSFDSAGGTSVAAISRKQNQTVSINDSDFPADPTKEGYTFLYWQDNSGNRFESATLTSSIKLTAKWNLINYNVTFNSNGGSAVESISGYTVESENVTLPVPSRTGCIFAGWQVTVADGNWTEGKTYSGSFSSMYGNVTLTAQWKTTVSATIDHNGSIKYGYSSNNEYYPVENGSMYFEVPVDSYPNVEIVFTPAANYIIYKVTKNGTEIENFELNDDGSYTYGFGAAGITGQTAIVVNTVPANHKVTYNANGGTIEREEETVEHGKSLTLSTDVTRVGYSFKGWYLNADFSGDAVTVLSNITTDMTVYAKWEIITYTLTYDYQYGSMVDSLSFTVENDMPTALPAPERAGHTFGGWFADDACSGSAYTIETLLGALLMDEDHQLTAYAKWTPNNYTVTFENWDGTELQSSEVAYGNDPVYTGATPTREGNAQYTYTFAGWDPELEAVTGDVTYTATYTETVNKYMITFVDEDGTVLDEREVAYGDIPAYSGDEFPSKEADAQYTYTFDGWTPELVPVTGEATYTATYTQTTNEYTIIFVDWNGTELQSGELEYGATPAYTGEEPTKAADARYTYTFTGWTPGIVSVTGDATYTATYTELINQYTVTFVDEDGTVLKAAEAYDYGTAAADIIKPADPSKEASAEYTYAFAGWTPAISDVTANATYKATYTHTPNPYQITWVYDNGSADTVETLAYGAPIVKPADPEKEGYDFTGWSPAVPATMPAAAQTFTAQWKPHEYTVVFDGNGGSGEMEDQNFIYGIDEQLLPNGFSLAYTVLYDTNGGDALAQNSAIAAARFAGWAFAESTFADQETVGNLTSVHGGTVTLMANWDLGQVELPQPTRYGYIFMGWYERPVTRAAEDTFAGNAGDMYTPKTNITLYAQWEAIEYTITWKQDDGTVIDTTTVAYDSVPTHADPVKAADTDYTYVFTGWTPEITAVTGETAYTATYDAYFDFKATIEHGTVSHNGVTQNNVMEWKGEKKGNRVGETLTFMPETGFEIVGVKINGTTVPVELESDGSYVHTFTAGMRAEEKLIEVVTKQIEVVINIQFTDGSNLLEIKVHQYSDILLAITPKDGTTINTIRLIDSDNQETTVQDVSSGYIYAAAGITESMTIVVEATSREVCCAAASIDHGTVSLSYGDTTVTSDGAVAGQVPYNSEYTFTVTADADRHLTKVDQQTFTESDTAYSASSVMNANRVMLAQTAKNTSLLRYVFGNGSADQTEEVAVGSQLALPTPVREGYVFQGWWYDKNGNAAVDADELLAAGASFTMPNHNVTMTARWLDSRLDSPHVVYVGINMSFYNSNGSWYYSLPTNEPAVIHGLKSVRVYKDTGIWKIQDFAENNNYFTKYLPGAPSLYIKEDVFDTARGYVNNMTNGGAEGIYDESGVNTRACLNFSSADYTGIIQAWLNSAESYLKGAFPETNLDWSAISKNAENYTITPYVIKRQNNGNWYIDMVIQPKVRYNITYKMNLENDYKAETAEFADNTGYGQGFQAKLANPKKATNANRPGIEPRFMGWWYDANKDETVDAAELHKEGTLFTMPAENAVLIAQWEYPKRLKISETSGNADDTFFFDVVGRTGNGTVMSMTVSVPGGGSVIIDGIFAADYTVTEKNLWSWTYETGTTAITKTVAASAADDTVFEFGKSKKADIFWLFDEDHN